MIKEYISYLKDNPNGYWFKRKLFGFGWTPARWQGWVSVLVYLLGVFILIFRLSNGLVFKDTILGFVVPIFILTLLMIFISYKKGESPKWQWGLPKNKQEK